MPLSYSPYQLVQLTPSCALSNRDTTAQTTGADLIQPLCFRMPGTINTMSGTVNTMAGTSLAQLIPL